MYEAGATARRQQDRGREGETGENSPVQSRDERVESMRACGMEGATGLRTVGSGTPRMCGLNGTNRFWNGVGCALNEASAAGRGVQEVCAGTAEHGAQRGQGKRGEGEQQREKVDTDEKSTGRWVGEGKDRAHTHYTQSEQTLCTERSVSTEPPNWDWQ